MPSIKLRFSDKQLEALLATQSERELSQPVREAVRMVNNRGFSIASAARLNKLSRQAVSNALGRLETAHNAILRGYASLI